MYIIIVNNFYSTAFFFTTQEQLCMYSSNIGLLDTGIVLYLSLYLLIVLEGAREWYAVFFAIILVHGAYP